MFTALLLADGVVRGDWQLRTPVRELLPAAVTEGPEDGGQLQPARMVPSRGSADVTRSTATDLLTFLRAQLDPASTPLEEAIRLTHETPAGGHVGMGLGWHRAGQQMLWHNGGTGGFRTIAAFDSDARTAVTVLVDQSEGADLRAMRLLKRVS